MNPGEMLSGKFTLTSVLSIGESTLYRRDQVSLNLTGEPAKEKSMEGYGRLQGGALGSIPPEEDFLRPRLVSLSPRELGSPSLRGFGSTSSAQAASEEMGALLFFPPSGWPSSSRTSG